MASAAANLRVALLLWSLGAPACVPRRAAAVEPARDPQAAMPAPLPAAPAVPAPVQAPAAPMVRDRPPRLVLDRPELGDRAVLVELRSTGRATTCVVDGETRPCRVGDLRAKVENRSIEVEPRIALLPPLAFRGELAFPGVTASPYSYLQLVGSTAVDQLPGYLVPYEAFVPVDQVRHGDAIAAQLRARVASHAASRCRDDGRAGFRDLCRYFLNVALIRDRAAAEPALDGIADCAISTIESTEGPPFSCQLVMVIDEDRRVWLRAVAGFGEYTDGRNYAFQEPGPQIRIFLPRAVAMAKASAAPGAPTRARQAIIDGYERDERDAVAQAAGAVRSALSDAPLHLTIRDRSWQREIWTFGVDPGNPSEVFANGLRTSADVRVIVRRFPGCEDAPVAWPKNTPAYAHVCVGFIVDSILTVSNKNTDRDTDWRRPSRREAMTYDQAILDSLRRAVAGAFSDCAWMTASDLACTSP